MNIRLRKHIASSLLALNPNVNDAIEVLLKNSRDSPSASVDKLSKLSERIDSLQSRLNKLELFVHEKSGGGYV